VFNSVDNSVNNSVNNSVGDSVRDSVFNSVWNCIASTLEGQHNAALVSYYTFFRDECGLVEETQKMTGIFELTENSGWVYMYKDIAFVCDRPCKLYRNPKGQLHSNDCAALEFPDGYKIYAWNGTRVPEYVILNPEKITLEDIMLEINQEVKRVKILKFGIDRLINSDQAYLKHSDSEFGELYHTSTLKDINKQPYAFLKVLNSTPEEDGTYKTYMLRVDPKYTNTREAWQSTFRKVDNFLPIIET